VCVLSLHLPFGKDVLPAADMSFTPSLCPCNSIFAIVPFGTVLRRSFYERISAPHKKHIHVNILCSLRRPWRSVPIRFIEASAALAPT
jgi:hypothetical protein